MDLDMWKGSFTELSLTYMKPMVLERYPATPDSIGYLELQEEAGLPPTAPYLRGHGYCFGRGSSHFPALWEQSWPYSTPQHLQVKRHLSHPHCRSSQAPGRPSSLPCGYSVLPSPLWRFAPAFH